VIPSEEKSLTSLSAGSPSTSATPMPKPPVPKKAECSQSELLACIPPTTPIAGSVVRKEVLSNTSARHIPHDKWTHSSTATIPQRSSIQLQRRPPEKGVSLASRPRVGCNSTQLDAQAPGPSTQDQSPWTGAVAMPRRRLHLLTEILEISSRQ
jgi:hypothetical protein